MYLCTDYWEFRAAVMFNPPPRGLRNSLSQAFQPDDTSTYKLSDPVTELPPTHGPHLPTESRLCLKLVLGCQAWSGPLYRQDGKCLIIEMPLGGNI
jgi:hypothetical protein